MTYSITTLTTMPALGALLRATGIVMTAAAGTVSHVPVSSHVLVRVGHSELLLPQFMLAPTATVVA